MMLTLISILTLVGLSIIVMIIGIFYPRDRRYQGKSLLKVEDLNSAKGDDKIDRLIDIFNHLISHNAQDLIARQNERTQTRISYIALMAALIIAVLPLEEMEIRMQFGIVLIELFLFLVFYLFDVHTVDLLDRQIFKRECYRETINQLIKEPKGSSNNYAVKFSVIKNFTDEMKQSPKRRKICNAFCPDLSQISFYFAPMVIVLLYLILHISYQN